MFICNNLWANGEILDFSLIEYFFDHVHENIFISTNYNLWVNSEILNWLNIFCSFVLNKFNCTNYKLWANDDI